MSDSRVIVALDYPEAGPALALAGRLDPARVRVKVGKELFTDADNFGVRFDEALRDARLRQLVLAADPEGGTRYAWRASRMAPSKLRETVMVLTASVRRDRPIRRAFPIPISGHALR